jgi:hypothetical protein
MSKENDFTVTIILTTVSIRKLTEIMTLVLILWLLEINWVREDELTTMEVQRIFIVKGMLLKNAYL